jgi:hypothetical protein
MSQTDNNLEELHEVNCYISKSTPFGSVTSASPLFVQLKFSLEVMLQLHPLCEAKATLPKQKSSNPYLFHLQIYSYMIFSIFYLINNYCKLIFKLI